MAFRRAAERSFGAWIRRGDRAASAAPGGSVYETIGSRVGRSQPLTEAIRPAIVEPLEQRIALTINYAIPPGATLDIFPISSIIPAAPAGMDRMEVTFNSVPGVAHGTIYRMSGLTAYPWGSNAPNVFKPGAGNNRIYGGEGLRYVNNGTGNGTTESIPVKFRDGTGFTTKTDTIAIKIDATLKPPTITSQPNPFIQITPGSQASMSVGATSQSPITYQWYKGIAPDASQPIAGATFSSYSTPTLNVVQQYYYWVKVTSNGVSVASDTVTVQVATPTSVTTSNVSTPYKTSNRTVNLNATVTPAEDVGKVAYTSLALASMATSATVTNGIAPPTAFTVPGGAPVGSYPFEAHYFGPAGVADSYDNKTITITKASTTTAVANTTVVASGSDQMVPLSATVSSAAGIVTEGTVTFTVFDGVTQIGAPLVGNVVNGAATVNFTLPANSLAGPYTVQADYNPGPNYNGSLDIAQKLAVAPAVTPNAALTLPANATTFDIDGFGFDAATVANNVVLFSGGVTGSVTAATPTQLTVSNVSGLVAGSLDVQVKVRGVLNGAAVPVATVAPVVTPAATAIKPVVMTLKINGFGFSNTASHNVVTFTPAVTGFVSTASKTQLTYVFTTLLPQGVLSASVTSNGVSSGAPVQVAVVDGTAPTAGNGRINLDGAALGTVSVDLSEDVSPALLLNHFHVDGVGAPAVTINPTGVVQDPATHTATFSFAAPFANRNYKGTLSASGLTDLAGNAMAADYKFNFFYLPGDASGNRSVGPEDFNLLATHFGQNGQTWANGDFTGNGVVGPEDFNLLASNFGTTLPIPPAALMAPPPPPSDDATTLTDAPVRTTLAESMWRPKPRHTLSSELLQD